MADWDRRTSEQRTKQQEALLRAQVVDVIGPFSPWWRARLKALGLTATATGSLDGLSRLPAAGERDVCPDGDPTGAAALVVQAGESGFALHAAGPVLRRALANRLVRPGSYRAVVEADTRPTSFVWAGLGMRFPVASTRSDLDVIARAGARLWQVLGLTSADVVVSALPTAPTAAAQALALGALGAASPLLSPGDDPVMVEEALRLVPATVLALASSTAGTTLAELVGAGAELSTLTTVLLVGAPYDDERAAVRQALTRAGVPQTCLVLAAHVPDGHRLMWAECRQSAGRTGLHTYPDLEVVQLIDPETGEASSRTGSAQEVVVTQLGLRGSALVRWRTGDVADGVQDAACSGCGRTVPRVTGLRAAALVPPQHLRTGVRSVDVRALAGALEGRADVTDWRVLLGPSTRDGADEVLVYVVPGGAADPAEVAVAVARDLRLAAGLLPTQVLVVTEPELPHEGVALSRRVLLR